MDMVHYITKILESVQNLEETSVPGNKNIFVVDNKSELLSETERKWFHTLVAKLLFLSKRARPEISTSYGFLCTRVTKSTLEDKRKLLRLLGFLKRTKDRVLKLRPKHLQLIAYIDAAFASHFDSKSHTGVALFLGGALIFIASRKQKCVTKSPTESDLVALTDYIGLVESFAEFVGFITNSPVQIPVIYQDSTSVISLITKGGGIVRTKHLRVQMSLCKEGVDQNKFKIADVPTKRMIADSCTKALEKRYFEVFMNCLLDGIEK